jgi:hypothetical protein
MLRDLLDRGIRASGLEHRLSTKVGNTMQISDGLSPGGGRHHFFCSHILQHGVVEHSFRQQLLQLRVLVLKRLQPLSVGNLQPAVLGLPFVERRVEIPCLRQISAVAAPASCSCKIPIICSSVKRLGFMVYPSRGEGLYPVLQSLRGSGYMARAPLLSANPR